MGNDRIKDTPVSVRPDPLGGKLVAPGLVGVPNVRAETDPDFEDRQRQVAAAEKWRKEYCVVQPRVFEPSLGSGLPRTSPAIAKSIDQLIDGAPKLHTISHDYSVDPPLGRYLPGESTGTVIEGLLKMKAAKPQMHLLTREIKTAALPALEYGAGKYKPWGWLDAAADYKYTDYTNALERHIAAWVAGEENDPESGVSHLSHAAANIGILLTYQHRGLGTDDRRHE